MAEKTITLKFDADTSEAQRKLKELGRSSADAPMTDSGTDGLGGVRDIVINSPQSVTINGTGTAQPLPQSGRPPAGGPPGGGASGDGGKKGASAGDILGAIISAGLLQKGASLAFNLGRDPLTSNRSIDVTESTLTGAGGGALAGVTLGKFGGPWGMAIGGLAGLLGGGALGYFGAKKKGDDVDRMAAYTRVREDQETGQGRTDSESDLSFLRGLEMNPGRAARLDMIRGRIKKIQEGFGARSVESISSKMRELERGGLTDSAEYQELAADRSAQIGRVTSLQALARNVELSPFKNMSMLSASSYADSFQKMGLTAGASVDVAGANREVLDILRDIRDRLTSVAQEGLERRTFAPAHTLLVSD